MTVFVHVQLPDSCPFAPTDADRTVYAVSRLPLNGSGGSVWASSSNVVNSDRVPENEIEDPSKPQEAFAGLSTGEIMDAVGHIRQSRTMKGCPKLMRMLDFVVEATVGGEAAYLKETTLGVFVFGRKPDYDPKVDTIVRSQAWRLRAKLKKYYATEGLHDSV